MSSTIGTDSGIRPVPYRELYRSAYRRAIARLGPEQAEAALKEPNVVEFDITGRPMKGWVMVEVDGLETDQQLSDWIQRSVEFVSTLPKK